MTVYWRPIAQTDRARPPGALPLAGGWCWFDRVERINRDGPGEVLPADYAPSEVIDDLTRSRPDVLGLPMNQPRIMGIVNVTPDSFSDGGQFSGAEAAIAHGVEIAEAGADILDIGGESTRPGAAEVPAADEIDRTAPVVAGLKDTAPVSIDTRKAMVATAALDAGAGMINDVSALSFDPALAGLAARAGVPVCLMHAQGAPETMQDDPRYEHVLLDVYDGLAAAVDRAVAAGIDRNALIVDPGIGFGKTLEHNLSLLRGLSLFHGLGLPILLGASRKRFIGTLTGAAEARQRLAGSLAVAHAAYLQGVQIIRVHDIKDTREALQIARALTEQT